ncbi:MAG: hypothetical protein J6O61_12150 [Butyrivibrio sp.]|uniref:hypothetical protein n=1 Tax=Butyrivibrio sp. TaxID=28121 RepID=UPI001B083729|nr:hypothetical protein [Butyrivibrio sp.]MBO6241569.1 hypothetical protein [Butyrivibrio sp.]
MGEQMLKAKEKQAGNDYFEYDGVRIIIKEHFNKEGKPIENIIEESVLRQARAQNRFGRLPQSRAG